MLAVENAWFPTVPLVTDEPALDEAEPPPERMVVVLPSTVVEEETLPPPAVTEVEVPLPMDPVLSTTVQVVPSSSLTVSLAKAAHAMIIARISGRAKAPLCRNDAEVMPGPPKKGKAEDRFPR
jgi:hypothetical protein